MTSDTNKVADLTQKTLMEAVIRISLIAVLVFYCVHIFSPFLAILLWGMILAIMLYPLHQRLAKWFGGKQGRAATALVLALFLLMGVPLTLLGNSFAKRIQGVRTVYQNNELTIKVPDPAVAEWPIIGKKLYKAWNSAATNMPEFMKDYEEQVKQILVPVFSIAKNAISSLFLFFGAIVIAGIMMAWGNEGSHAMSRILIRFGGPVRGPHLQTLSVATTRSVATGVLGVAFIQALLFGIGFIIAGIPAAGLLAMIVMFLGIIQLPAVIVSLPVVIYLWTGVDSSFILNIFYTVYFVLAGTSDSVLKPMLLGRGVDAPMPVILIGALGGMVSGGFIGLFLGAILLAMGYNVFMAWVNEGEDLTVS